MVLCTRVQDNVQRVPCTSWVTALGDNALPQAPPRNVQRTPCTVAAEYRMDLRPNRLKRPRSRRTFNPIGLNDRKVAVWPSTQFAGWKALGYIERSPMPPSNVQRGFCTVTAEYPMNFRPRRLKRRKSRRTFNPIGLIDRNEPPQECTYGPLHEGTG